jgi:hypothetical protein
LRPLVLVTVLASIAGCSKAPSCKEAITKALGQLRADSDNAATMIGWCEQQDWSADVRNCVAGSKSQTELSACMARDKKAAAAEKAKAKAEAAAQEAATAAQAAQDKVDKLTKDLADIEAKIATTTTAAGSAAKDADKAANKSALDQLRKDKAEAEKNLAAAKIAAAKADHLKAQTADCAKNPTAKGC